MGSVREGIEPQSGLSVPELMVPRRPEASNSKRWKLGTTIEKHSGGARPTNRNEDEEGWSFETPGSAEESSITHAVKAKFRLN